MTHRARSRYGNDQFDFPLFGDLPMNDGSGGTVDSFRRLILRNSGGFNNWEYSYYRDAFIQELVRHLPIDMQAYRPVIHFINGAYWGLINFRERLDAHYLASHYDLDPGEVVILTTPLMAELEVDTGVAEDLTDFLDVVAYAEANHLGDPAHLAWIRERVDTDNLALYYAVQVFINNKDWPDNNNDLWRKRTDGFVAGAAHGHDGRWRWLLYDTDFGFGGWNFPRTGETLRRLVLLEGSYRVNPVAQHPVNRLFRALVLESDVFRAKFINHLADQMNSSFDTVRVLDLLDQFEERIGRYRVEHNQRWAENIRRDPKMEVHANERPAIQRQHVLEVFGLSAYHRLDVDTDAQRGVVKVNRLRIDGALPGVADPLQPYPWSGLYYEGIPVRLEAFPKSGFRFARWTDGAGGVAMSEESTIFLNLTDATTAVAVFEAIDADAPQSFEQWRESAFPNPDDRANTAIAGRTADPGGHGMKNLMRYALGIIDPAEITERQPQVKWRDGLKVLKFPYDSEKSDIRYRVHASDDLQGWDEVIWDSTTDDPDWIEDGWVEVMDVLPGGVGEGRFLRLEVE